MTSAPRPDKGAIFDIARGNSPARLEAAAAEPSRIASELRAHPTAPMPVLHCLSEGQPLVSVDWSLGGLHVAPYAGMLRPGAEFSIGAVGAAADALIPVGIRARATRVEGDALAALFIELDARAYDALEALMMRRRGSLASLAATARAVG
jgi:hypothetical protein